MRGSISGKRGRILPHDEAKEQVRKNGMIKTYMLIAPRTKSIPDVHLGSFTEIESLASDSLRSSIDFSIAYRSPAINRAI